MKPSPILTNPNPQALASKRPWPEAAAAEVYATLAANASKPAWAAEEGPGLGAIMGHGRYVASSIADFTHESELEISISSGEGNQ